MKRQFHFALLTAVAMTLAACGGNKEAEKAETTQSIESDIPEVKIADVTVQSVSQDETYTATVEGDVKNNIAPNAPYRIKNLLVEVGDYVKAGQVVAILDAAPETQLELQMRSQEASIHGQEANIQAAMATVQNQQVEYNRIAELYRIGGTSKSELDAARTQLTVQQKQLDIQRKQLEALKSQLNVINTQRNQTAENTKLVSPISGVVTARNYDNGDMYGGQPVYTVQKIAPVKLIVNISEPHYKDMIVGMPITVKCDAYEGEIFGGKVSIVYPAIDETTHTFPVEITIPNSEQKLRPGMFARAEVNFGDQEHVIVPDLAIVKQIGAGDRYVYTYKDGKVSYDKVELGKHIGTNYEIISGVEPGAKVVIAGHSRLSNGREVKVIE